MTDREKLIEVLRVLIFHHELVDPTEALADYLLDNGVVVREKGEWATEEEVVYRYGSFIKRKYCTGCNESPKFDRETGKYILTKFCPNCGADMRRRENG